MPRNLFSKKKLAKTLGLQPHGQWAFKVESMVSWFAPGVFAKAAVRAVLTNTIGQYGDRREYQGGVGPAVPFDYSNRKDLWIDFVADCGDGFESTFAVARTMAEDELSIDGDLTKSGSVLIFGGDQVYPDAYDRGYENRLIGPYDAAFQGRKSPPDAFAIPGNHDWYDGLAKFLSVFCKSSRVHSFASIHTPQQRSYWALQLPGNWLCLGLDWHVGVTMDLPQFDYFKRIAAAITDPTRVILVVANPVWIHYLHGNRGGYHELLAFIEELEGGGKLAVDVVLTGDLHCYARYEVTNKTVGTCRQLIMAGGGGAYLYPTHGLPLVDRRTVHVDAEVQIPAPNDPDAQGRRETLHVRHVHPSPDVTDRLARSAKWLPRYNWALAFFLIGPVYLLLNYVFRSTSRPAGPTTFWSVWKDASFSWSSVIDSLGTLWSSLFSLSGLLAATLLTLTLAAWALASSACEDGIGRFRGARAAACGLVHGLVHLGVAVLSVWLLAAIRNNLDESVREAVDVAFLLGIILAAAWYRLPRPVVYGIALFQGLIVVGYVCFREQVNISIWSEQVIVFSGSIGTLVLGLYLRMANLLGGHSNDVMACQSIRHYKNFLRLHVTHTGELTIYPVAIDSVPAESDWQLRGGKYVLRGREIASITQAAEPPWKSFEPPA